MQIVGIADGEIRAVDPRRADQAPISIALPSDGGAEIAQAAEIGDLITIEIHPNGNRFLVLE